jgi:hypothetical protein
VVSGAVGVRACGPLAVAPQRAAPGALPGVRPCVIFVRWLDRRVGTWHGRPVGGWHLQRDGESRTLCGIPDSWHPHYRVLCPGPYFSSRGRVCWRCVKLMGVPTTPSPGG